MTTSVDVQKYSEFENYGHAAGWYVINTNPRCEEIVYHILSNEAFEVFLPKIPKRSNKKTSEPLFPGYLFAKLNLDSYDWVKIKYLQGVRKILSFGNVPVSISEEIIASIRQRAKSDGYQEEIISFKCGDKVRFTGGPFEGLEGIFTGEVSGKERVKVLLKAICSWAITVEVSTFELSNAN